MSYCRCDGECKVYMYRCITGGFQFHLANDVVLKDPGASMDFYIKEPKEALRKLKRLQTQGFGVPEYATERLEDEIKKGFHRN